ncbi:hypothetical protein pEaSNUABM40_00082 [Erwinia phage pEa_SNUABM_40]|nr:hypothetical protein pEaSNUABM40_00082 [Erwinia phage pEa_SNUABM_40]
MKILPIYQNTPVIMYGAFMEGNLPNPVNYDIQTLLNNMVSGRMCTQQPLGASLQQIQPAVAPNYQVSPAPAWTTAQGFRGKRVLPKVTFASYSTVYQDVAANLSIFGLQLDMLYATILMHRVASTSSATLQPCASPSTNASVPVVKQANADGTWTLAEYDFGAEVVINSLAGITLTTAGNNLFANTAANLPFLQVQQGSSWVDVTNLQTNLFQTSVATEKFYQLPSTVQGRRFRIVSKAVANPFPLGIGTYALHFYGEYAAGTAPRTLGKIQHAVMFPLLWGTSYNATAISTGLVAQSYGRIFPHYGLTVTDDLKQSASFDLVLNDATVYPGQEQAVGSFNVTFKPVVLEVY